jgi:hypothetical protein
LERVFKPVTSSRSYPLSQKPVACLRIVKLSFCHYSQDLIP